ncbi:uncharacterized protein DEA37_0004559 [Paragonimus westermani]|uniref:Large ribosomal subunit protein mL51 n=1 Tax=Paragonimus westermani TaxID=34504 RepID=A0A5J4NZ89_9TREM|nr:uncharacterized protein DEA37_0004559 [Paragonimus westermani]
MITSLILIFSTHIQCYEVTLCSSVRLLLANNNNLLTHFHILLLCSMFHRPHIISFIRQIVVVDKCYRSCGLFASSPKSADLGLRASSSYRSPKSWKDFGVDPERAGTQTIYRDLRPQFDHQADPPHRIIPVPHCGGGGGGVPDREPYLQPKPTNLRYNPRLYEGGLLPRLEHTDEPVRLPEYRPRDKWAPHRAHFGQNDYIDLLGDGDLGPRDFYTGPPWILGARNEFQRVCARVNNPAIVAYMEEFEPSRLKLEQKNQRYLYKKDSPQSGGLGTPLSSHEITLRLGLECELPMDELLRSIPHLFYGQILFQFVTGYATQPNFVPVG